MERVILGKTSKIRTQQRPPTTTRLPPARVVPPDGEPSLRSLLPSVPRSATGWVADAYGSPAHCFRTARSSLVISVTADFVRRLSSRVGRHCRSRPAGGRQCTAGRARARGRDRGRLLDDLAAIAIGCRQSVWLNDGFGREAECLVLGGRRSSAIHPKRNLPSSSKQNSAPPGQHVL